MQLQLALSGEPIGSTPSTLQARHSGWAQSQHSGRVWLGPPGDGVPAGSHGCHAPLPTSEASTRGSGEEWREPPTPSQRKVAGTYQLPAGVQQSWLAPPPARYRSGAGRSPQSPQTLPERFWQGWGKAAKTTPTTNSPRELAAAYTRWDMAVKPYPQPTPQRSPPSRQGGVWLR